MLFILRRNILRDKKLAAVRAFSHSIIVLLKRFSFMMGGGGGGGIIIIIIIKEKLE